jgi:CIC family chloride channel protein
MNNFFRRLAEKIRSWSMWSVIEQHRLMLDSIILGVVGALSAQLFLWLLHQAQVIFLKDIAGYIPIGLPSEGGSPTQTIGYFGLWLIPLSTTIGGLAAGILIYSLSPEAEGHGTDTAIKAFHQDNGFIRTRVPFVKMIASAITLGSGGAAGREGPTALISAGIGSIYGTFSKRPDKERRMLVLIGEAAGLSAIFRSPIGTAVFATEVLYGNMEFESDALIYTMVASVVAYAVNGLFVGWSPLFLVSGTIPPPAFGQYFRFILLGIAAGIIATFLPMVFYTVRDGFRAVKIPPHFKPAIGGLIVGLIGIALPGVLGGGYGWIQAALNGQLSTGTMALLGFGMILALPMTISSGGSGGVFAPSLFVGGMLGGFLGNLLHQPTAPFVIVGMMAVFAGAARVPIAAILMVTEMTGGYNLLAPAALTVVLSYFVQVNLSSRLKYKSLYHEQVAFRYESPSHREEQLEAVLKLLGSVSFSVPSSVTHLDLRKLLLTGVPVDLPDYRQMVLVTIQPGSPSVDKTLIEMQSIDTKDEIEIISGFRKGHMLLPHSDLKLQAGDRLLAIVSSTGSETLMRYITPLINDTDIKPSEE